MKHIELTQGQWARVSDEDYRVLTQHKWQASSKRKGNTYYAQRASSRDAHGKQSTIMMHRVILGAGQGQRVDHVDHNGLHNERENIRLCTDSQNCGNARKRSDATTSRYKGVHWNACHGKWRAVIKLNGKSHYLGYFDSELDAARAYDDAARKLFADFALPNFA